MAGLLQAESKSGTTNMMPNVPRLLQDPIAGGIVPVSSAFQSLNDLRFVNDSTVGNVPTNDVVDTSTYSRFGKATNSSSI